jgi:hypothetical protein
VGTLVSARGFLENECSTSRGSFFGVRQFCGSSLAGVGTVQYFFLVSNSRGVSTWKYVTAHYSTYSSQLIGRSMENVDKRRSVM